MATHDVWLPHDRRVALAAVAAVAFAAALVFLLLMALMWNVGAY